MKIVYLTPRSGYKTDLRSDTLWGLLCWGIRHLYGEAALVEFLEEYEQQPSFTVSSCFPFKQVGEEYHRFFPVPQSMWQQVSAYEDKNSKDYTLADFAARKTYKKVKWLSETTFRKALRGEFSVADFKQLAQDIADDKQIHQLAPTRQEQVMTHNTIDRITLATYNPKNEKGEPMGGQLFHNTDIYWDAADYEDAGKAKTGIFFLARGNTAQLEAVLRFYQHTGMGGDTSTGKGAFEVTVADFEDFSAPANANALLNLSLYQPKAEELAAFEQEADNFHYQLTKRVGKVGFYITRQEKQAQLAFIEGSVFPSTAFTNQTTLGKVLKEEYGLPHPVYRYLQGFMLPCKVTWLP